MKKFFTLSLYLSLISLYASAGIYDAEIDGIYYNLVKKAKAAEVVFNASDPYSGNVVIPSTFDYDGITYIVKGIESMSNVVGGGKGLTSVTIPNTVTYIGDWCFYGCSKLTSLEIPNSVTSIGEHAFDTCQGLTTISLPNSIQEISKNMFSQCIRLEAIDIPLGVTVIRKNAFYNCPALKSVNIPFGLIQIEESAFWNCKSLKTVDLPTVIIIEEHAFKDCIELTKLNLGYFISLIYSKAFANCNELTDVYCYRDSVLSTNKIASDVFSGSQVNYATLHVVGSLVNEYKKTKPWSEFGTIVAITDEENGISDIRTNEIKVLNDGGVLTVQGGCEGEYISVYNLLGRKIGSGVIRNNSATIMTNLNNNDIAIIKIGNKTVKITLK